MYVLYIFARLLENYEIPFTKNGSGCMKQPVQITIQCVCTLCECGCFD